MNRGLSLGVALALLLGGSALAGQLANPAAIVGNPVIGHVPAFDGHQGLVDSGLFPAGGLEPIQITGDCTGGPLVSIINVHCQFTGGVAFGPGATAIFGTSSGTMAQGNDTRILGALQLANNLSDLGNLATAQSNLGLGTSAFTSTGTSGGTLGLLNGNNTYSGANTFSGINTFSANNIFSSAQTFQGNNSFTGTNTISGTFIFSSLTGSALLCLDSNKHVTTSGCPGGGGGGGNVTGPVSSVNGNVAVFNGATGTILSDSGVALGTAASATLGTSGATVPLLSTNNTWTTANTFPQITLSATTGTAPLTISSTTNVANLNASLLNGQTFASPAAIGSTAPAAGNFTTLGVTNQITSTLATGSAPLVVASTTNVANLNASSLNGATFAAPGAIGGTTASAGSFTTLNLSSAAISSLLCTDGSKNVTTSGCSASATGNVNGPGSSTVGHVALFNNTGGTLLSDGGALGTASAVNTGTSGATIGLLNGNNTESGNDTFSGVITLSSLTANSVVCLDASKHIVSNGCVGSGTVMGPVSSTVGHFAVFSSTDGTVIDDGGPAGTAAGYNVGVSGGTIGLLNGSNNYSGTDTFSGTLILSSQVAGAIVCTDVNKHLATTGCPPPGGTVYTPSITGQFGTGATLAGTSGAFFTITVGTGLVATSSTITFAPAAPNAIFCLVDDVTTRSPDVFVSHMVGPGTTTTAVIGNHSNTGTPEPWLAGDKLNVTCQFR